MAGQGPAPAEKRRRRNEPLRGEWVDLPPLEKPVLPNLPKREKGTWSARAKQAWAAWRDDPVTAEYTSADIQAAVDLIYLYQSWIDGADVAAEIRQRQDRLGLNPKGKRDLRWRVPKSTRQIDPPKKQRPKASSERRARLSVVK